MNFKLPNLKPLGLTLLVAALSLTHASADTDYYRRQSTWVATVQATRTAIESAKIQTADRRIAARAAAGEMGIDFPVQTDWVLQDAGELAPSGLFWGGKKDLLATMTERAIQGITANGTPDAAKPRTGKAAPQDGLQRKLTALQRSNAKETDVRWLELYLEACEARRAARLETVLAQAPQFVFMKKRTIRPSFFAYTEGQSDAQNERHFPQGSELCLLQMDGLYGKVRTLVADPAGAIRDPAVSWEADRVVFAWKKSLDEDDYHLYELNVSSGAVRQLTFGLGFADYEPAFLPNGDLIFSSTRCVQTVDCWWTEVSNLYTCDADGKYLRRVTFDQVHAIYPQVLDDGRVVYTRWDYNDRGQIFPQPLFQMASDGTGQTEYYGNNSWFPTTIAHARGIPGTEKVLSILCGHHSSQAGKLAIIDPARGRQENTGVQLVAPRRPTPAERIDGYGQHGPLWQYPFALNEQECLVGFAPLGWDRPERFQGDAAFGIYWMDMDGNRELLVSDPEIPCSQPVPLVPRRRPAARPELVNHARTNGVFYMQDVYHGPGLTGIERGTIKKLRVVALDFRAAGVGANGSEGPGGGALISTPVAIGNGTWDVKQVLGEAEVYADGSAMFTVPAKTPVYFQAVDARGYAVQTMRSWSTLQPGETLSCVGCHESKDQVPPAYGPSLAMKAGAKPLSPFHGPPRGFSFRKEVQPILDRHCTRCHNDRSPIEALARGADAGKLIAAAGKQEPRKSGTNEIAFSLLGDTTRDEHAKRLWSDAYLMLTQSRRDDGGNGPFRGNPAGPVVSWIGSQSVPEMLPPNFAGSTKSELMRLLEQQHKGVRLEKAELEIIACWIDLLVPYSGDYVEANAWSPEELAKYQHFSDKRRTMQELEAQNIRDLLTRTP